MRSLIITDLQNDFMPGGALGIKSADLIVPLINHLIPHFEHIIATVDWHPLHHVSFASTHGKKPKEIIQIGMHKQILWPDHCVQCSWGASLVDALDQTRIEAVFHKGVNPSVDSYSVFFDEERQRSTGLAEYLKNLKCKKLYFCGLATDYCVLYSVLDALELGFTVTVIRDACCAINLKKGDEETALKKMQKHGANVSLSKQILTLN